MGELKSIQMLRGLAALLVVYTHLTGVQGNYPDRPWTLPYGDAGAIGVDIFFVISGFIIAFILARGPVSTGEFAARRFFRIVPIYWGFTALALAAVLVNPAWTEGGPVPTTVDVIRSFLVLPQDRLPVLFVGWSIEHEALFYAVMGVMLAAGKVRFAPVVLVGLAAIGFLPGAAQGPWSSHLFSKYNLLFATGILVYQQRGRLCRIGAAVPLLSATLVVSVLIWSGARLGEPHDPTLIRIAALATASVLLFAGLLNLEQRGAFRSRHISSGVALAALIGDASFVLYLSHPFILSLVGDKLGVKLGVSGNLVPPWLAVSAAAAIAVAIAIHKIVEKPLLKYTHRLVARLYKAQHAPA